MSSTSNPSDLVSKCVAAQYGIFIASAILIVIIMFNYYQNYSAAYLANCSLGHVMQPSVKVAAAPAASPVAASTSQFASHMDKGANLSAGRIDEMLLSQKHFNESFLGTRPDFDKQDFENAYFSVASREDPTNPEFDPARESLEQSVFDSHNAFVDEAYKTSQGPNLVNVERDDAQDINPRWGMRRTDYTSVSPEGDARTTASEYPEQLAPADRGSYIL